MNLIHCPTLLDDLLEDSARVYHHHCAIIQSIFHKEWLKRLEDEIGKEQIESPDDKPALIESRVRQRLQPSRHALHKAAREMIREQRDKWTARDAAILAYVASRHARPATCAA